MLTNFIMCDSHNCPFYALCSLTPIHARRVCKDFVSASPAPCNSCVDNVPAAIASQTKIQLNLSILEDTESELFSYDDPGIFLYVAYISSCLCLICNVTSSISTRPFVSERA